MENFMMPPISHQYDDYLDAANAQSEKQIHIAIERLKSTYAVQPVNASEYDTLSPPRKPSGLFPRALRGLVFGAAIGAIGGTVLAFAAPAMLTIGMGAAAAYGAAGIGTLSAFFTGIIDESKDIKKEQNDKYLGYLTTLEVDLAAGRQPSVPFRPISQSSSVVTPPAVAAAESVRSATHHQDALAAQQVAAAQSQGAQL